MKTIKKKWYSDYPEHNTASIQKLRENASRFKKKLEINNQPTSSEK